MTKPSAASELIERAERESGGNFDDPDNPDAINIIFGAVARAMGKTQHKELDDLAAGILIRDDLENGEADRRRQKMLAALLCMGMSPDDLR